MLDDVARQRDIHVFLIAGEPSGDALGAKLMHSLKKQAGEKHIRFSGIGGERMAAEGLRSLIDMSELSVMGFAEVLPHIRKLRRRIDDMAELITDAAPDILVTIDSPGFCTRVVKKIRKEYQSDMPIVHYVAPTVWAYKPKRAKKFAGLFDHLLVLLPFEPPYFEVEGLATTFVGHPVIEEPVVSGEGSQFRLMRQIAPSSLVMTMLAGSREGEVARLLPVYRETVALLAKHMQDITVVLPTLANLQEKVAEAVKDWPVRVIVTADRDEKYAAYAASSVALAKSGTATLELALARVPMVVNYKVNPLTAWLLRCMIKTPYVNLINIVMQKPVIPELIQGDCTPKKLAGALETLILERPSSEAQVLGCQEAFRQMGKGQFPLPSEKAAAAVLSLVQPRLNGGNEAS